MILHLLLNISSPSTRKEKMPGLIDSSKKPPSSTEPLGKNGTNGQSNPAFEMSDSEVGVTTGKDVKDTDGGGGGGHGIDSDHPTSYLETTMHIFKGNVGPGLYAMGQAFFNGGIVAAPILTVLLGITCIHSQHLLVRFATTDKQGKKLSVCLWSLHCINLDPAINKTLSILFLAKLRGKGKGQTAERQTASGLCGNGRAVLRAWTPENAPIVQVHEDGR